MNEKNNPVITVVTVVLNAEKHIEKTILSVINQTYQNIEYIVIDGGSTDGTLNIIKKYQDKITFWKSEPDEGIFDAMNKGIDIATGVWINFMNAGDYFYSDDVLERIFQDKEIKEDFIYGGTLVNFHIGKYISRKEMSAPELTDELWKYYPCHQSCFIRTVLMKQNLFKVNDPVLKVLADCDILLDFYYKKKLKFRRENIIVANFLGGGFSSAIVFENPTFSGVNLKINRWKLISRYINHFKVHIYYILMLARTLILIILLKFIPDVFKLKIFQKFYLFK
ncbi:MAG TPA: glycosyltransferase family 2 protein [Candidatus Gastranaerophilales bacterium]|nr:glycosyltransferase family 2 protein [Candidatus Gastranaerophilales bacterium]